MQSFIQCNIWLTLYHGSFPASITFSLFIYTMIHYSWFLPLSYLLFSDLLPLTATCAPNACFKCLVPHELDHLVDVIVTMRLPFRVSRSTHPSEDSKRSVHRVNICWQCGITVTKVDVLSRVLNLYSVYVRRKASSQIFQTLNHDILSAIAKIQLANHTGAI